METRPGKKSGGGPFEKLGLSKAACEAARSLGYDLPTPIQRRAIPAILANAGDVLANARTGSGKTAAFLLPVIDRLERHSATVGVRGLLVLPTRELALQTGLVLRDMIKGCGRNSEAATLRVCYLIGGMSMAKQFEHLSNNPDILVCTPGRLVHQMVEADFQLTRVEMVVFDEGDLLFEMGFEDDINRVLKAVASCVKKQIVIASATLPTQLVQFARAKLQNPQFIYLDAEQNLPDTLELQLFFIRQTDKTPALLFWLENVMPVDSQCIVFCATAHHVAYLAEVLRFYQRKFGSELHYRSAGCKFTNGQFSCTQLAGQLTQTQRDEAMKDFVKQKTRILLATDVAARGVDIDKLDYVVHYTFPPSPKLFVHRSGRAARKGQKGVCVSFVCREEFPYLMDLLLFVGRKLKLPDLADGGVDHAQIHAELERFSFDFGLGGKIDRVLGKAANGSVDLGGLPDLNEFREVVASAITNDVGVEKLANAMAGGEKAYMRHRQPASKQSLKRSAKVLDLFGGPSTLADRLHPALASCLQAFTDARRNVVSERADLKSIFNDFKAEIKVEEAHAAQTQEVIEVDALRQFRPSAGGKASRGLGLSAEVFGQVEELRTQRHAVREAARVRDTNAEAPTAKRDDVKVAGDAAEDVAEARKRRLSKAERRRQGESDASTSKRQRQLEELTSFAVAAERRDEAVVAKEMGLSINNANLLERTSFGLLGEENPLRKPKRALKWNAARKKYEMTDVDRKTGRRVRNDAGQLVESAQKGLYKRWASANQRRIQNVGEQEDATLSSDFLRRRQQRRAERFGVAPAPSEDVPRAQLSELTSDKGLLEKLERKLPLTHREERKHKRLLQMQANPIVTGTAANTQSRTKKVAKSTRGAKPEARRGGAKGAAQRTSGARGGPRSPPGKSSSRGGAKRQGGSGGRKTGLKSRRGR